MKYLLYLQEIARKTQPQHSTKEDRVIQRYGHAASLNRTQYRHSLGKQKYNNLRETTPTLNHNLRY